MKLASTIQVKRPEEGALHTLPGVTGHAYAPRFHFQKYHSNEAGVYPFEALAILKDAEGAIISNDYFFDRLRMMPEELQVRIDRTLVPLAIRQAVAVKKLPVAVNVHLATLVDLDFQDEMDDLLDALDLPRDQVMFEIVEPHAPTPAQCVRLKRFSSRTNAERGYTLILDDHNFDTGGERLALLSPYIDMLKTNLEYMTHARMDFLRATHPHLTIVLERVSAADREAVYERFKGVAVQGLE